MLKLGCTLPNLANLGLHSSISEKFYSFTESDKNLLSKIREEIVGAPSILFTRKAVVDRTHNSKLKTVCKTIVGIDASQCHPCTMCQPMTTGLYTRYEFDADLDRFKPRQNRSRSSEKMIMSYFQRMRQDCRVEMLFRKRNQKSFDCFNADRFCG